MKLKVLGCGDAFGSGGRFNTSFMLFGETKNLLIDCGASTLIRMKQEGIRPIDIDAIIITHFHGDHYGGLPFQIISNKFEHDNRSKPLTIWGPHGVKDRVVSLQEAMYPGTVPLLEELDVVFKEFVADAWVEFAGVKVFAKTVTHSPPSSPHGIKVQLDQKMFAFSGDTEWDENLIELAEGSDLFIVECNNLNEDSPGHLSYQTILRHQSKLKTNRIMLSHMGLKVLDAENLSLEQLSDGLEVEF